MAGLFYLFIPITHTSFASFNSLYVKKKQYFDQEKRDRASKNVMQAESARDLLGAATRVRESAVTESYRTLSSKKAKGKIAALVADPILRRTASSEGWLAQSNHILQNGVSTSQYLELEGAITAIERQHGGSTMTAG
jgi:peptidyl-tRNA hydrolase